MSLHVVQPQVRPQWQAAGPLVFTNLHGGGQGLGGHPFDEQTLDPENTEKKGVPLQRGRAAFGGQAVAPLQLSLLVPLSRQPPPLLAAPLAPSRRRLVGRQPRQPVPRIGSAPHPRLSCPDLQRHPLDLLVLKPKVCGGVLAGLPIEGLHVTRDAVFEQQPLLDGHQAVLVPRLGIQHFWHGACRAALLYAWHPTVAMLQ